MMTKIRCLSFILLFCLPVIARAIPIGVFSWIDDPFLGPVFSVENNTQEAFSLGPPGQSFLDVMVLLQLDGGGMLSLSLGDIPPGSSASTSEDLTGVIITSADLDFDFPLPGTVFTSTLTGEGSVVINFEPATPISEPPVWGIFLIGLILGAIFRVRRPCRDLLHNSV